MLKSFETNGIRQAKKYATTHGITPNANGDYICRAQWKGDYREYITTNIISVVDWVVESLRQNYTVSVNDIMISRG